MEVCSPNSKDPSISPSTKNLLRQDPTPLSRLGVYRRDQQGAEEPGKKLAGLCELAAGMFAWVFSTDLSSSSLLVSSAISNLPLNPLTEF